MWEGSESLALLVRFAGWTCQGAGDGHRPSRQGQPTDPCGTALWGSGCRWLRGHRRAGGPRKSRLDCTSCLTSPPRGLLPQRAGGRPGPPSRTSIHASAGTRSGRLDPVITARGLQPTPAGVLGWAQEAWLRFAGTLRWEGGWRWGWGLPPFAAAPQCHTGGSSFRAVAPSEPAHGALRPPAAPPGPPGVVPAPTPSSGPPPPPCSPGCSLPRPGSPSNNLYDRLSLRVTQAGPQASFFGLSPLDGSDL